VKELAHSSRRLRSPSDREDAEAFIENVTVEAEGISLRDYWRVIRRWLWLIATFSFATVFATVLVLLMMTPIYTAETTLLRCG
jgi:type IV secretory pathway component VirB8